MIAKMIEFLYRSRYNDNRDFDGDTTRDIAEQSVERKPDLDIEFDTMSETIGIISEPLITNAKMYILGDKYEIPSLKSVAARKYGAAVKDQRFNNTFTESAELVYSHIVDKRDALKDIIVEAACNKIFRLLLPTDFVNLMRANGDIATDILHAILGNKQRVCVQCTCSTSAKGMARHSGVRNCTPGLWNNSTSLSS
jgi:hypothetical protein